MNLDVGKYNTIISDNNTSTPSEPTGKTVKIPLSAYNDEQVPNSFDANNINLLNPFYDNIKDILDKYTITRFPDGRDYLLLNKGANEFDYKNSWYIKKGGNLMMGEDNAKDLVVTNEDKSSNYADDGSVKVVNPNKELNIFGSDTANKITVDGAHINEIYAGVGEDNITVNNGAEITHDLNTGSGNDNVLVTGKESKVDRIHLRDGEDKIEVSDEAYWRY